jgi:2-polyprenyl-6-hydroxyphenyl methylase/3-demethylubiquinone-9 3-methyltransferase
MQIRWKIAQAAELRWWQGYLRKKEPKAYLQWKKNYWKDFLQKCEIEVANDLACLDAGCGPAGIFTILDKQQVDAIDPLLLSYEEKLSVFKQADYPWVRFLPFPIEALEAEKRYDFIFCLNAINHVSDWAGSIDKLMRALKPNGTLLLSTDVHRHNWLKPIFRLLPGDILHPQQHSLKEYLQILETYKPQSIRTILIKREGIFDYYAFALKV